MYRYQLKLINKGSASWGEAGNIVRLLPSWVETVRLDLWLLSAAAGGTALDHTSLGSSCHVSPLWLGLIANTSELLPLWYSIISHFYEEPRRAQSHFDLNPCEGGKLTARKQPNGPMGTMCVSVCVPWGPLCVLGQRRPGL